MDLGKGMTHDACRDICIKDGKCLAYTYVKAGVQGSNPRCWLKGSIPAARSSDCCISGVVRTAALPSKPQPVPAQQDFGGIWDTQMSNARFTLVLKNEGGSRFSGVIAAADNPFQGRLDGTVDQQGVLRFTFDLPSPKLSGSGSFFLSADGKSLDGRFTTATAPGAVQLWTGTRRN